jgi:hypothetical protein
MCKINGTEVANPGTTDLATYQWWHHADLQNTASKIACNFCTNRFENNVGGGMDERIILLLTFILKKENSSGLISDSVTKRIFSASNTISSYKKHSGVMKARASECPCFCFF